MQKESSPEYAQRKKIVGIILANQRNKRNPIDEKSNYRHTTQEEIGKRAGVTRKRVFQWEKGDLPNDRDRLLEIIRAYQFTDRYEVNHILQTLSLPPRWPMLDLTDEDWEVCQNPEIKIDGISKQSVLTGTIARQFQAGRMTLPLVRIIGGNGEIRYKDPDGISTIFHNTRLVLPQELHKNYHFLLELRKKQAAGAVFEPKNMIRLEDYEIGLSDPDDAPWPLVLHVSLTDYFDMMVTNRSLNTILPGKKSPLRDTYAEDALDFRNSKLSNSLTINLSLVTAKDSRIYVARRGSKVATNPDSLGPAVSGTASPFLDLDDTRRYNPFLTAQRESYTEITQPYKPDKSEITIFGLARTSVYFFPFLFGELRLNISEGDLPSFVPQDNWEAPHLVGIPFTIDEVVRYIKELYRYMVGNNDKRVGTAIFSLYESLIYQYPDQREEIIKMLSEK